MIKNVFLFLISLISSVILVYFGYVWIVPENSQILKPFLPKTFFSIEYPPRDSLSGNIASMSGNVAWQSRSASTVTNIHSLIKLQQGEEIDTQDNGNAIIDFPSVASISAFSKTQINFIQTLPANFVVWQKEGHASYEKTGNIPVSIRALDLLINVEKGTCGVSVDKDTSTIIVSALSGNMILAYVDTDNNTVIIALEERKEYIFNNDTKLGKIISLKENP